MKQQPELDEHHTDHSHRMAAMPASLCEHSQGTGNHSRLQRPLPLASGMHRFPRHPRCFTGHLSACIVQLAFILFNHGKELYMCRVHVSACLCRSVSTHVPNRRASRRPPVLLFTTTASKLSEISSLATPIAM